MTDLTHETPELELFELPEDVVENWHDLDADDDERPDDPKGVDDDAGEAV